MLAQKPEIIIVTGDINSGKSRFLDKLYSDEKRNNVSGIIARGVFEGDIKIGFDVIDLSIGASIPLARTDWNCDNGFSVGKYIFSKEAFNFACRALLRFESGGIVFLDEVGPLELRGGGYADCLMILLDSPILRLYVVVRSECLEEFKEKFIKGNPVRIITC